MIFRSDPVEIVKRELGEWEPHVRIYSVNDAERVAREALLAEGLYFGATLSEAIRLHCQNVPDCTDDHPCEPCRVALMVEGMTLERGRELEQGDD